MSEQRPAILVEIGALELTGLGPAAARRVAAALTAELERLLGAGGLPAEGGAMSVELLEGELELAADARPEAMGAAAARTIYTRLRR